MLTAGLLTALKSLAGAKLALLAGLLGREIAQLFLGIKPRLKALLAKLDAKLGLTK